MYGALFKEDQIPTEDILLPYKLYIQIMSLKEATPIKQKKSAELWTTFCRFLDQDKDKKPGISYFKYAI